MATATYTPIATTTLGSATNVVSFTSISGTYTDLRLVFNGTVNTNSYFTLRFNGDTANNYSNTELGGDGSSPYSARNGAGPYAYIGSTLTTNSTNTVDIMNYSNTTTYKSFLSHTAISSLVKVSIGLWRSTAAITQIDVGTAGANVFQTGSTFTLYGIKAA